MNDLALFANVVLPIVVVLIGGVATFLHLRFNR